MKKIILNLALLTVITCFVACNSNEKLNDDEEQEVNDMIQKDQERADSMRKALENKYN
jgi:type III secretory pathway lipoprotein EscJ